MSIRDGDRRGVWTGSALDLYALTSELGGAGALDEDSRAESDAPGAYPEGSSIMPASEEANWAGQNAAASIITWRTTSGTWQWQIFHEDNESWHKFRFWVPDTPGWSEVGEFAPYSALSYFVPLFDYEDADVLAKVKNVDGSGSGLDADLLDGLNSSAFLQSAFYQTIKEDGTARTQRANVNFTHALDAADNSGTGATDVSVDESELTHDSLGGLTSGDPHTQYHNDTRGDARYTPIAHVGSGGTAHANAVASGAAGFLTGSDKAKLDGVESGATADQTAAEILTAIKTVDGAGSGLDADLLDGQSSAAFAAAGAAPTAHAASHTNGTDDIQNATASQKGLATATQITKLDGIESGATADQTAAEILTAIKTVDGSGSGLDADTIDGIDSSAFLQSAFYQTIKEGGTARTQRAAINFGNGLDATDDAGNNETDVVVDESELTHNSLGGLTTGDPHTQYHNDTRGDLRYAPLSHVGAGGAAHANAVAAGAAGFMTGSDKTKLDGIETAATADQTAAEILTAIKTVDGTGSGLDADTLDGVEGTGYTPIAHVGSGGTAHANAVASGAAGFLTGSDKAKLDGVESGATADQTASEILSALLAVDGAGSLLDADKLDGQEGSYYRDASNLNAGTVPTARLGSGTADSTTVLKGDNTWGSISAGSLSLTEVEVNLGSTPRKSGNFQITGLSGLTTGRHVLIRQAVGPYTGKGTRADEFEMDALNVAGKVTNATTIQCYWKADGFVKGNFKLAYAVG